MIFVNGLFSCSLHGGALMTATAQSFDFRPHFASVEDPRIDRTKDHQLLDILFISVAATIAGADGPTDIANFAREKLAWCRKFVPLKNGVPSHDTIGRVLSLIKPDQFQAAFLGWIASFASQCNEDSEPRLVPIDGKTLRGSGGAKHRSHPLHLVSAWATKQGLTLGQVAVDSKSNEITAIPKLLEMLELSGAIISIDAMGCQRRIAAKIINGGGDYVLAAKDNQPNLSEAIHEFFLQRHENEDFRAYGCRQHTTIERSRGRIEERYYSIGPVPESMKQFCRDWKGLKSIGQVITTIDYGGKQTNEVRYYISSREPRVKEFAKSVRGHWSIESMHWILDVVFAEDSSRIRNGDGTENFGLLRKFVISLFKRDTSQGSLRGKRKRAGWNTKFLEKLLFG
jgi:predicted transposase YbfD/YdcC